MTQAGNNFEDFGKMMRDEIFMCRRILIYINIDLLYLFSRQNFRVPAIIT